MTRKIDLQDVVARLARGEIIPVSESDWTRLAAGFPVRETIATGLAGEILLVRRPLPDGKTGPRKSAAWAIVEEPPRAGQRVIRPFTREKEARALIADRMAAYERMWDG